MRHVARPFRALRLAVGGAISFFAVFAAILTGCGSGSGPSKVAPYVAFTITVLDMQDGGAAGTFVSSAIWKLEPGGSPVQLTDATDVYSDAEDPAISPDGFKIAFSAFDLDTGHRQIFTMWNNGVGVRQITAGTGYAIEPAWSPDGTTIAYSHMKGGGGLREIWMVRADGTYPMRVTTPPTWCYSGDERPNWSPDGRSIAFQRSGTEYGTWNVGTVSVPGGVVKMITTRDGVDADPAWRPDGKKIAFASNRLGFLRIFQMNPDGSGVTVTDASSLSPSGDNYHPTWTFDGARIYFIRRVNYVDSYGVHIGGAQDIWSMRADGGDQRVELAGSVDPWGGGPESPDVNP